MDGNGRWAKKRGLLRTGGHEAGAEVVEQICEFCIDEGIANLTLYAFSTENWKRPKSEVEFLMKLLQKFLISRREKFIQNGIKFYPIGDISAFDGDLRSEIEYLSNLTQNGRALNFNLAINYGSRDEIVRACERLLASGERLKPAWLQGECAEADEFCVSADGSRLALINYDKARIIDLKSGNLQLSFELSHVVKRCEAKFERINGEEFLAVRTDYGCFSLYRV